MMLRNYRSVLAAVCLASPAVAQDTAQTVAYSADLADITQAASADLTRLGALAQKPEGCGAVCLQPTLAATGVATVAEPEVIGFVGQSVANGAGLLIDARLRSGRDSGAIVGSTNIPVAVLAPDNPYRVDILMALGATRDGNTLQFDAATPVMIYDGGPSDSQATALIAALLQAGYPAERITYYRGGMLVWVALGLSVTETAS